MDEPQLIEVQVMRESQPDYGFCCTARCLDKQLAEAYALGDIEAIVIEYPNGEQEIR